MYIILRITRGLLRVVLRILAVCRLSDLALFLVRCAFLLFFIVRVGCLCGCLIIKMCVRFVRARARA